MYLISTGKYMCFVLIKNCFGTSFYENITLKNDFHMFNSYKYCEEFLELVKEHRNLVRYDKIITDQLKVVEIK